MINDYFVSGCVSLSLFIAQNGFKALVCAVCGAKAADMQTYLQSLPLGSPTFTSLFPGACPLRSLSWVLFLLGTTYASITDP